MITIEPIEPSNKPKDSPPGMKDREGFNNGIHEQRSSNPTMIHNGMSIFDSGIKIRESSQITRIQPGSQKPSWIQRAWCFLSYAFADKPSNGE